MESEEGLVRLFRVLVEFTLTAFTPLIVAKLLIALSNGSGLLWFWLFSEVRTSEFTSLSAFGEKKSNRMSSLLDDARMRSTNSSASNSKTNDSRIFVGFL